MVIPFWELPRVFKKIRKRKEYEKRKEELLEKGEEGKAAVLELYLKEVTLKTLEAYKQAKKIVEEELSKNPDPVIKTLYEHLKQLTEEFGTFGGYIGMINLASAIKAGLHKDKEKLYQFLIKAAADHAITIYQNADFPEMYFHPEYEKKIKQNYPKSILYPPDVIDSAAYYPLDEAAKIDEKAKEYAEKARKLSNSLTNIPEDLYDAIGRMNRLGKEFFPEIWEKEIEEILGLPREEERAAPKIITQAVKERLPSAAYRLASLIHLVEEGKLDPETALAILRTTHSPYTPQGTGLYNLIYRTIQRYEEEVASGKHPTPPSKVIKDIVSREIGLRPWEDPKEFLRRAEVEIIPSWILAKMSLGIPVPGRNAARALRLFLEHLERLEKGRADPHELDTMMEIANLTRHIPDRGDPDRVRHRITPGLWERVFSNLYRDFFDKAQDIGKEEEAELIRRLGRIVYEELSRTDTTRPYYKVVSGIMKRLKERLEEEGYEPGDVSWAVNTAQHVLLTLPLHAVDKEELHHAKALLVEGFNPEEYETLPMAKDLVTVYERLQKLEGEERKAFILELKNSMNALEALKGSVHRALEALEEGKKYGVEEARMASREPRFITILLIEAARTVSGGIVRVRAPYS